MNAHRLRLLNRWLVIYYGLWQALHWVFNLYGLWIDPEFARVILGGDMTAHEFEALLAAGYLDFFLVSPLTFVFVGAYLRGSRWAVPLGAWSLALGLDSAYLMAYLHLTWETAAVSAGELLVWASWLGVPLLCVTFTLESVASDGGR